MIGRKIAPSRDGFSCGVDEVGLGALAGPVVAAAVILPRGWYPSGLNDSKRLSKLKRNELYCELEQKVSYGIGIVSSKHIDRINILRASLLAMSRAINRLTVRPNIVLVDGVNTLDGADLFSKAIISGDRSVASIAAASVLAKVYRDNLMTDMAEKYPEYEWNNNAGYGTKRHLLALKEYGITIHHRCSFSPIYKILWQENKITH